MKKNFIMTDIIMTDTTSYNPQGILHLRGTQNHIYHIRPEDIFYIRADSLRSYVMCPGCLYHVRHQLIQLEELVPDYYVKLNRSVLLNTRHVWTVHEDCIEFTNHTKLVVTKWKAQWLKEQLEHMKR